MTTFFVILGLSALLSFWLGNAWYMFPLMIIFVISFASATFFAIGIISVEFSSTNSFDTKERWFVYTVFTVSLIIVTLTFMYFSGAPHPVYEPRTFMLQ